MVIRRATVDDVDALVTVHLDTVLVAYRDWFPPEAREPDRAELLQLWSEDVEHAHAIEALHAGGHDRAELWVLEANARARSLYERNGWTLDPAEVLEELGVREVRYLLDLS